MKQTKTERGLCCEPFCRNRKRKDRFRCFKCDARRKRKANPIWAAWRALKDHAKARRIPFSLSLPVFKTFALQSDYLNRTGSKKHHLTVDRKDNARGYHKNNIQPLTREANSIKKARQDAIRMKAGYSWQETK